MQEVGQRVLSLVVAWPVWTGFLLLVSVFAISVRTADLVSMEMYIPFFALACLAIVRLYGGSGFNGDKSTGAKCPSQRLVGMVGGCATLILFLSILFWMGLEGGLVLPGEPIACRQVNDVAMLLCASISIACWYQFSFGFIAPPVCGVKGLRALEMLLVLIVGAWMFELAHLLLRAEAVEFIDGTRFIMGRFFGITAASLSALALRVRSDSQGGEVQRGSLKSGTIGASCAYYDVLRSLERVKLSDRELKVLSFTLEGESARSIGEHLGVSAPTVGSYRQRGYKKMGVSSKKELIDLVSKYEGDDGLPTPGTATVALPCSGAVGRAGVGKMPMGEDSRKYRTRSVAAKISIVTAALCLAPLCLYGIVHYVLQATFTNDFLFYFGDPIKHVTTGVLVISAAALVACSIQKEGPSLFSSIEENGPSMTGFIVVCVGVFCSSALVGESFYSISAGGVWGFIGLAAAFTCIALSGEGSDVRGVSLIGRALKLVRSSFPEVLLLFSVSISLADVFSSILLSVSIDSYPLVTGLYRLGVITLVVYALVRLYSTSHGEELAPSKYEQLRYLLLGHGLTELQAAVLIMSLQGHSTASICAKLLLAPGTVRSYRARAYAKLGVRGMNGLREVVELEMQSSCGRDNNTCSDG